MTRLNRENEGDGLQAWLHLPILVLIFIVIYSNVSGSMYLMFAWLYHVSHWSFHSIIWKLDNTRIEVLSGDNKLMYRDFKNQNNYFRASTERGKLLSITF